MSAAEKPPEAKELFTAANLDGHTIGTAFMIFVIKDIENRKRVRTDRRQAPSVTHVFDEGRFPDGNNSLRWPTNGLLGSYLIELMRKTPPTDLIIYRPLPPQIEASARRLVSLANRFFDFLRSGEVIASGIYAASGADIPVSKAHWARRGMFIDLCNSDLLEEVNGQLTPRWTGLILSAATSPRASEKTVKVGKENTKRNSSNASKIKCRDWLENEMRASPNKRPHAKSKYFEDAKKKFPDLSERSFNRAWSDAIEKTNSEWDVAGRPAKSPH
jgi:hypothetical protein